MAGSRLVEATAGAAVRTLTEVEYGASKRNLGSLVRISKQQGITDKFLGYQECLLIIKIIAYLFGGLSLNLFSGINCYQVTKLNLFLYVFVFGT